MANVFDYIIIGGGSAGCVLANRLSKNIRSTVLLIEAGQDTLPGAEPADILNNYPVSYYNKSYMWPGLRAHWRDANGPSTGFPQGRVMGGGSSVMGMVALRGVPDDYNGWEADGAEGWGWQDVLPWFRTMETDMEFGADTALHGQNGPVPIRRAPMNLWPPLARAIEGWANDRQLPTIADMNADFRDGYGALPMSNTLQRRASAAMSYLTADIRQRPNLRIETHTQANRLIFEGTRAIGLQVKNRSGIEEFSARNEVFVCTGALHSPAFLLRNGIGNAEALRINDIPVICDLPGVGENLQNHALLFLGMHLPKNGRQSAALNTHPVTCLRMSSGLPGCGQGDIYINIQSKTSWNALGTQVGNIAPVLHKPLSRGRVGLMPGALENILVEFNFAQHDLDLARLKQGFRISVEILNDRRVNRVTGRPFPLRFTDRLRKLNEYTRGNRIRAALLARLLDAAPPLADWGLSNLVGERVDLQKLIKDDAALTEFVRANVAGMFHVAGTCRMGRSTDRQAVVDNAGRVHGLEGLRVVDASIMPSVPRGNTNIPTIMLAEKIAASVVGENPS